MTSREIDRIRRKAEEMKPLDAVNYLLSCLESLGDLFDPGHAVDALGVAFTPVERRVMIALWDANGRTVTKDAVFGAMAYGNPRLNDMQYLNVIIHNIRKKLPAEAGTIRNVHGIGYMLVRNTPPASAC